MRKTLKILASSLSLIACVAAIVFWVRSYRVADIFGVTFNHQKRTGITSEIGYVFAIVFDAKTYAWAIQQSHEWDIRSSLVENLHPKSLTSKELADAMGGLPKFKFPSIEARDGY